MKKILLVPLLMMFAVSCTEKNNYEQAVLEEMSNDKDVLDYGIDPVIMTDCVVDVTSKKMPGIVNIDPMRQPSFERYSKLIQVKRSKDPKKSLQEVHEMFESPQEIRLALQNYSEGVLECMTSLVSRSEEEME